MSNSITFFTLFALITAGLFIHLIQSVRSILKKTESTQKFVKKAMKWPSIQGSIQEISINMDYPWPCDTFNDNPIDEISQKRSDANATEVIKGILITYRYTWDNTVYTSTSVQMIPTQKILDYALNKKVGETIEVFVNPRLPGESVLIKSEEDDVNEYTWMMLKDLKPVLVFSCSSFFMTMVLLFAI